VLVADNGSRDGTPRVVAELMERHPEVSTLRLTERGRGRALRAAWLASDAEVLAYTDVDLAADLGTLPVLIDAVGSGRFDIAIGSRHAPGARVRRSLPRDVISRGYNVLIRAMFHAGFRDAQCGFKVLSRDAARRLVPLVRDNGWFFDTELLLIAEALEYRILEQGLDWVEGQQTRVHIPSTALADLHGLLRMRCFGLRRAVALARRASAEGPA
jgi:glycosyltransferase involved in cell wall biosynthesis